MADIQINTPLGSDFEPFKAQMQERNRRSQESRVRRLAQREGYRVEKSRQREHLDNHGAFMLVDNSTNFVVLGAKYDATLDEIERWLQDDAE